MEVSFMARYIIPLLIFLLYTTGTTQGEQWVRHTAVDGLPSNKIYEIFQDSSGYLWVSTPKGIGRYNGEIWETFNVDVDGFYGDGFYEDSQKRLWTYGDKGIWRYDGKQFKRVLEEDVSISDVKGIFEDSQKQLWAYGCEGIWWYNGSEFGKVLAKNIDGMFEDSQKRLWTYGDKGIWRYDGKQFKRVLGKIKQKGKKFHKYHRSEIRNTMLLFYRVEA